jgi:prepilin-type N-terminal cleavage/methylation domain-containing protein
MGRKGRGFSLLEVLFALLVLAAGAMVTLGVITSTAARNEITKEQAIGYKACQDIMEALMNMDRDTLITQKNFQGASGSTSFQVTQLHPTSPPTGAWTVRDITASIRPSAPADSIVEIQVRFDWKNVKCMLTNRRYLP